VSTIIPDQPPEPTYRAVLTIPAGIDETRLAVCRRRHERDRRNDVAAIGQLPARPRYLGLGAAPARLRSPVPVAARAARVRLRGRAHRWSIRESKR
jgi:hypothetical protein